MKPIKELERCDICDEPTDNAGVDEDSIVCDICGEIICEDCTFYGAGVDYETTVCVECILKVI